MTRALRIAAVTLLLASPVDAQRFSWQPGDRVLVGMLGDLRAIAASPRNVYAAGPAGVAVYDLIRDAWAAPLPFTNDMPLGEEPSALAYDRTQDALWLGTANGALYTYALAFGRWERTGAIGAGPVLYLDAAPDALYIAMRDGWQRLPLGAFIADRIPEADVPSDVRQRARDALGGRDAALGAVRGTIGLDASLRRWPVTALTHGETPGEYWLATAGGGLIRYDARRMDARWLPIGLPTQGATAITIANGDVWIGGDARGPGGGIARTSTDFTHWTVLRSDEGAPGGLVREIVPSGGLVWVAAADGLYRLEVGAIQPGASARAAWRRITAADGLPTDRVAGVAAVSAGVWAATTEGLAFVGADGAVAPFTIAPGHTIVRAVAVGDTLWVASEEGVLIVPSADDPTIRPGDLVNVPQARPPAAFAAPGTQQHPLLRGRIADIAAGDGGIVALAGDALFRYDGARWIGPDRGAEQAGIGRAFRVRTDGGRIWIAGERGAAVLDTATGAWTSYLVPADIPAGPVADVVADGEHVWLATPLGVLRLRIRS